jgi:hypothetical protein
MWYYQRLREVDIHVAKVLPKVPRLWMTVHFRAYLKRQGRKELGT